MPNYTGGGLAALLGYNSQAYLWVNEAVTAPQLSIAFEIKRIDGSFYPWGLSAEVTFSGNPGTFEVDIMGSNNNSSAAGYIQIGTINSVSSTVAGAYVGRWDMPSNIWPKFVCGYLKTLTNPVNITLQVTR